jgi:hypothetical protein
MQRPFRLLLAAFVSLNAGLGAAPKSPPDTQEVLFEPKSVFPTQGGPGVAVAFLGDKAAMMLGGIGSIELGHGLSIGVAGYSLSSELITDFGGAIHDVGASYYGLLVENSFFQRRLFYFKLSTLVGLGQASAVARQVGSHRNSATFFLAEPSFEWMVNVTREARVGLGIGYRLTAGADVAQTTGVGLQGFSAKATLYYGKL